MIDNGNWTLGYLCSFMVILAVMAFLLINLVRYNWKNGEFKTRLGLQVWGWFKILHVLSLVYNWHVYGSFLFISLCGILYVVMRNYITRPS